MRAPRIGAGPDAMSLRRWTYARTIAIAGFSCGGATLLEAAGSETALRRQAAFQAGLVCIVLFVMYSLLPVRLNLWLRTGLV